MTRIWYLVMTLSDSSGLSVRMIQWIPHIYCITASHREVPDRFICQTQPHPHLNCQITRCGTWELIIYFYQKVTILTTGVRSTGRVGDGVNLHQLKYSHLLGLLYMVIKHTLINLKGLNLILQLILTKLWPINGGKKQEIINDYSLEENHRFLH